MNSSEKQQISLQSFWSKLRQRQTYYKLREFELFIYPDISLTLKKIPNLLFLQQFLSGIFKEICTPLAKGVELGQIAKSKGFVSLPRGYPIFYEAYMDH